MRKSFNRYVLAIAALAFFVPTLADAGGGYEAGVALSGQTLSIPVTQIKCGVGLTCQFGLYRATISCMTTKAGLGRVSVEFGWTDFGNVQTANSGTCALNTVGANSGISIPLYLDGIVNPTYKATVQAGPGSATWRANVVLERLQ